MSMEVRYTPSAGGRDRLLRDPAGPLGRWLTERGLRAQNTGRRDANVRTGLMRSRTEFRLETGTGGRLVGVLAARTNYARWVHDGARGRRGNPFLLEAVRREFR